MALACSVSGEPKHRSDLRLREAMKSDSPNKAGVLADKARHVVPQQKVREDFLIGRLLSGQVIAVGIAFENPCTALCPDHVALDVAQNRRCNPVDAVEREAPKRLCRTCQNVGCNILRRTQPPANRTLTHSIKPGPEREQQQRQRMIGARTIRLRRADQSAEQLVLALWVALNLMQMIQQRRRIGKIRKFRIGVAQPAEPVVKVESG